jgi:hypothetical protein
MRFIMTARPGEHSKPQDPNAPMDEKLFSAYMAFNEELHRRRAGRAEGTEPGCKGARVEVKKGKRTVVDGPFTDRRNWSVASTSSRCRRSKRRIEWALRARAARL